MNDIPTDEYGDALSFECFNDKHEWCNNSSCNCECHKHCKEINNNELTLYGDKQ